MKYIFVLFFLLFNLIQVKAEFITTYPSYNYLNSQAINKDLNALEKYALNKTYRRESDLERLERLENLAFGATQFGDLDRRFSNVERAILSRPKSQPQQSLLNNLANYFSGQATGFTPNLTPYPRMNNLGGFTSNPYLFTPNPNYNSNRFENYSNGLFGGGWRQSGHNFGTGSSIRILD